MNIDIGSLVCLRKGDFKDRVGIILELMIFENTKDSVFAYVYWQDISKTKLEFVGDLQIVSD
jgi:hypothetical protein